MSIRRFMSAYRKKVTGCSIERFTTLHSENAHLIWRKPLRCIDHRFRRKAGF